MDISKAILERKSIRGYSKKPVPKDTLSGILEKAIRSPSATNTQPWAIYVISDSPLENMKKENVNNFLTGVKPSVKEPELDPILKLRRQKLAKDLFTLLDIEREDKEKRRDWAIKGLGAFDAPVLFVLTTKTYLLEGTWSLLALGSLMENICLLALEENLGTCICEQSIAYHQVIKNNIIIPEDETIIMGITLGYIDYNLPVNKLKSSRTSLDEVVKFFNK